MNLNLHTSVNKDNKFIIDSALHLSPVSFKVIQLSAERDPLILGVIEGDEVKYNIMMNDIRNGLLGVK